MSLRDQLSGGDKRMNYMVRTVVNQALVNPGLFVSLVDLVDDEDPLVRMRAADAIEKASLKHPDWLQPYAERIVGDWSQIDQQEVRWHVALLLPRIDLTDEQRKLAIKNLSIWVGPATKSNIVRVFSLQALFDLKASETNEIIVGILNDPKSSTSLTSRANKLLNQLQ
jgi:hypothetical protein